MRKPRARNRAWRFGISMPDDLTPLERAKERLSRARARLNAIPWNGGGTPQRVKALCEASEEVKAAKAALRAIEAGEKPSDGARVFTQERQPMPYAAPRPCTHPGCGRLNCQVHVRKAWERSGPAPKRITGRVLQRARAALFAEEPLCRACKTRLATIRDHIIPLAEHGTEDPSNIQPLCKVCSDQKTAGEAARGRGRASRRVY